MNAVATNDKSTQISDLRNQVDMLKNELNSKPTVDESNGHGNITDKFTSVGKHVESAADKLGKFAKEHPVATQAGIFGTSMAVGYGVSRHSGGILEKGAKTVADIKTGIKGTVGKVVGGVFGLAAGIHLSGAVIPIVAGVAGGPAGLIAGIGFVGVTTLAAAKIGKHVGRKL
ncbi:MAG: hypothetical protein K8T10_21385 [Candidatus Eremiobacteraeota bacterium]|nr:hypothetical protein [Candidatus Eremiobacteraeota bacterium]